MSDNIHEYVNPGVQSLQGNFLGRGLVTPQAFTGSVTIYRMVDVEGFSLQGSLANGDFTPGDMDTYYEFFPGISGVESGNHEITPFHASVSFTVSGLVTINSVGLSSVPGVLARIGFGTQRQYFETGDFMHGLWCTIDSSVGFRSDGLRRFITPILMIDAHAGNNAECQKAYPEVEMDYDAETETWSKEISMASGSILWGFTGEQYQPDWYYHYCRYKKFDITLPSGWTIVSPDPFVEDIPFSNKIYMDNPKAMYFQVTSDGGTWGIDWNCTWPGYHYGSLS